MIRTHDLHSGASFEIKLEDPEAELTQAGRKDGCFWAIEQSFSQDQKEKVLDNFKLLDQSKSGQDLNIF